MCVLARLSQLQSAENTLYPHTRHNMSYECSVLFCHECRIPLVQRHAVSPDVTAKPKQDKANKAAAKQKEDEQPQIQDADERLLADVHGQATAAVDKIVCSI